MTVTHDSANHRFIAASSDGEVMGEMTYVISKDNTLVANHTHTNPRFRGQGIATRMLDAMVDFAKANGMVIVPLCSFVAAAFAKDPFRYRDVIQA